MSHSPSTWLNTRASGVLAHVSSLPGEFGIGNVGEGAREFIRFLGDAGMHYWQVCPIGPTGYGDSPYQSFSSFAGNPYFIDLAELENEGLLTAPELAPLRALPAGTVEYGELYALFWQVLATAHSRFVERGESAPWGGVAALASFQAAEAEWLDPYANFKALKEKFSGRPWTQWPEEWRAWRPDLASRFPKSLEAEADNHRFYQFVFDRQWTALREFARAHGVQIIGDVPIFVALDSADTWRSPEIFRLDATGNPEVVAGVPPDYFSETGQLWGNPLYDWERLSQTGYGWWIKRLRRAFDLCDVVRLDHFRGFDTYWEIPADSPDAVAGSWRTGPGLAFFDAVRRALPGGRMIAEDLGYITPGVAQLRRAAALPGMKILQFSYGHDDNNVNLPHFFPVDSVVFTGTHDNDTTRGWLESLDELDFAQVADYFGLTSADSAWPVIRAAFASVARLAIVPMQDLLDLPSDARLNRPGSTHGNWRWRFTLGELAQLRSERAETLRHWNRLFDRNNDDRQRDYSAPPVGMSSALSTDGHRK